MATSSYKPEISDGVPGPTSPLHGLSVPSPPPMPSHRHPIPHPCLGDDVSGVSGIVPQLAAQPLPVPDGMTQPLHRFRNAASSCATPVTRHPSPMPQSWTTMGISRGWVMARNTTDPPRSPTGRPSFQRSVRKLSAPLWRSIQAECYDKEYQQAA